MIENLRRSHGPEPLRLEGSLPPDLRGRLYRAGPGAIRRFNQEVHPFLADGALHRIDFGTRVLGSSRMVETEEFLQEERAGRVFSGPNASLWRRLRSGLTHHVKSTGNTNVMHWQDRIFALMEAGLPVEIEPETLKAHAEPTGLGILSGAFSAHPHRVATLGAQFNFTVINKNVQVYCFPDQGPPRQVGQFELPHLGLIHDFMVTEKHAVFFLDPGHLTLWRAALQTRDFTKWFRWEENGHTEVVLVPIDSSGDVRRFELPPFRIWHFVNAYERGSDVVIDAIRHDDMGAITKPVGDASGITDPRLTRYIANLHAKTVQEEALWEGPCEFPRVRPLDEGLDYESAWVQTFNDAVGNTGFARVDVRTGKSERYHAPAGMATSEPVVVDGATHPWILQVEGNDVESSIAVHDARTIGEEPVARVFLSEAIPPTFHGIFVPE